MNVGLYVTCLVDLFRPRIGFAALTLLESAGCAVSVPSVQTCCGQPGYNSGDRDSARALALNVIDVFEGFDYVVAPSGSCAGMMRTHYPDLFTDADEATRERVRRFCAKVYELTDFLVNVVKWRPSEVAFEGVVTYHDSCSGLRELGIKSQPRQLLQAVKGLQLEEMQEPEACCGFGGAFSMKFGEIAAHIADRKCDHVSACGASALLLGDLGCMLHIEGRLRRRGDKDTRVMHVAEVLAGPPGTK